MTLTLKPGDMKVNVFPVVIVDVFGTAVVGAVGVLLAVSAPVRIWAVLLVATVLNGRVNVIEEEAATVFEIWRFQVATYVKAAAASISYCRLTLILTVFVAVVRVTLQKTVPVELGKVLGRYSSPLFKLNSCCLAIVKQLLNITADYCQPFGHSSLWRGILDWRWT